LNVAANRSIVGKEKANMSDLQDQLAALRRKMARIDRKYADGPPKLSSAQPPERYSIEGYLPGEVVQTALGAHFETEKVYEPHRRHGSVDISTLAELPLDLLGALSDGEIQESASHRWAFLDTETTGLAGGTGTYAFLVGVGSISTSGFRVRQFFMRDYGEENSLLDALARYLDNFDVLITYNGRVYDQPLLETRFRLARAPSPFERMRHLDLLYGARRLWKLRLESCRLIELENRILGVEREGDLPGELIPHYYFEYLRSREAFQLVPIFHHNVIDILSLACLTAIVPFAFREPEQTLFHHGADLIGLARWMIQAEQRERGLSLLRRAVDIGLPDGLLFRTLWDIAMLEKKLGAAARGLGVFTDLAASRNPYRQQALVELAKYYEHRERNYSMALEMTRSALALSESPELRRREQRLRQRLEGSRNQRLAL